MDQDIDGGNVIGQHFRKGDEVGIVAFASARLKPDGN